MIRWQENLERQVPAECLAVTCNKDGCTLDMEGAPAPFVLIDLDCMQLLDKFHELVDSGRCDYLFVGCDKEIDLLWVVPIEMKMGNPKVTEIKQQLQHGATFAESLLSSEWENLRLLPLAVHATKLHKAERNRRRKKSSKVKYGNRRRSIHFTRCGSSLADSLQAAMRQAQGRRCPG